MKEQKVDPYPTVGYTCVNEQCLKVSSSNPEIKAASFFFYKQFICQVRDQAWPDKEAVWSDKTKQQREKEKRSRKKQVKAQN